MNGSHLGRLKSILLVLLTGSLSLVRVAAHDAPTSFIDLRVSPKGIDASVTASNTDLAHELPSVEPDMLLQPVVIEAQRDALTAAIQSRLQIVVAGNRSQRNAICVSTSTTPGQPCRRVSPSSAVSFLTIHGIGRS